MWNILVVHAFSQHVIYTLMEGAGKGEMTWKQQTKNDCHK